MMMSELLDRLGSLENCAFKPHSITNYKCNGLIQTDMKKCNFHIFNIKRKQFHNSHDVSISMQNALHVCLQTLNSYLWLRFHWFHWECICGQKIRWHILENVPVLVQNVTSDFDLSLKIYEFICLPNYFLENRN